MESVLSFLGFSSVASVTSVFKCFRPMADTPETTTVPEALANAVTQNGTSLAALSEERPILLVFLRQFG